MRAIVKGFVIGTLGLAWLLVPVGYVYPVDNTTASCAKEGYVLCKDGNCGNRKCYCNNKVLTPGDTCTKTVGGKSYFFMCDGCSGKVISVIKPPTPQPGLVKPPAGGTLQK